MTIRTWLDNNFAPVVPTSDGGDIRINCPFCTDSKQHLYVNQHKSMCHCFKCDWAGSHYELVASVSGAETALEVWQELKNLKQSVSDFETVASRLEKRRQQPELARPVMPSWYRPFTQLNGTHSRLILNYALKRLPADVLVRYGIGYCNDYSNKLALRLIIPVEDNYWQARAIGNEAEPKYLNPEYDIGAHVFNPAALEYRQVIICEGAISAIAAGTNAIATLGKKANPLQLRRLGMSKVDKFTIAYDAGEEHSKKAVELAAQLASYGKAVVMRAYAWGDPDSCDVYEDTPFCLKYRAISQLYHQRPAKYKSSIG